MYTHTHIHTHTHTQSHTHTHTHIYTHTQSHHTHTVTHTQSHTHTVTHTHTHSHTHTHPAKDTLPEPGPQGCSVPGDVACGLAHADGEGLVEQAHQHLHLGHAAVLGYLHPLQQELHKERDTVNHEERDLFNRYTSTWDSTLSSKNCTKRGTQSQPWWEETCSTGKPPPGTHWQQELHTQRDAQSTMSRETCSTGTPPPGTRSCTWLSPPSPARTAQREGCTVNHAERDLFNRYTSTWDTLLYLAISKNCTHRGMHNQRWWEERLVEPASQLQPCNNQRTLCVHHSGGYSKCAINSYSPSCSIACDKSTVSLLKSGEQSNTTNNNNNNKITTLLSHSVFHSWTLSLLLLLLMPLWQAFLLFVFHFF